MEMVLSLIGITTGRMLQVFFVGFSYFNQLCSVQNVGTVEIWLCSEVAAKILGRIYSAWFRNLHHVLEGTPRTVV